MTDEELGMALRAFETYNWKAKRETRIHTFDKDRWLRVVRCITGVRLIDPAAKRPRKGGSKWSASRRAKFTATMARKSRERAKFNGLRSHA